MSLACLIRCCCFFTLRATDELDANATDSLLGCGFVVGNGDTRFVIPVAIYVVLCGLILYLELFIPDRSGARPCPTRESLMTRRRPALRPPAWASTCVSLLPCKSSRFRNRSRIQSRHWLLCLGLCNSILSWFLSKRNTEAFNR